MKPNQPKNQLRIIAGVWRGRKLQFASQPGLRPTPDRVRETLFNWLNPVISGARCLDLFAGSGALGLEAVSRGAAGVVMVDSDVQVVNMLQEQVRLLAAAQQVRIMHSSSDTYLQGERECFDIVFLDPPFHSTLLDSCIQQLEAGDWLSDDARIYIEAERRREFTLPGNWELYRSKTAGQVGYHLARRLA